jgi:hypothetical protein
MKLEDFIHTGDFRMTTDDILIISDVILVFTNAPIGDAI